MNHVGPNDGVRMAVNRYSQRTTDGDEFEVIENVPVLDEHTDEGGVHYDEKLLREVAENNNQRIEDTGDYCPIVIGHTSDDKSSSNDPEVIGYAGPFSVGVLGKSKRRPAIFAVFRIMKDKLDLLRKYPRRSVEIWPEDKPSNRYIDPIAVLGAETPRRDLGLVYSKGQKKLRYQNDQLGRGVPTKYMAAPGGSNTFMPSTDDSQTYAKEEPMSDSTLAASPDVINQVIQGLLPTMDAMLEKKFASYMKGMKSDMGEDAMEDVNEDEYGEDGPVDSFEDEMGAGVADSEMPDEEGKAMFAKMYSKYGLGTDKPDLNGARQYMASMDSGSREMVTSYAKNCASDDERKRYEKCCTLDSGSTKMQKRSAGADVSAKYRKALSELETYKAKYQKSSARSAELADQLATTKHALRYSKTEARLSSLESQGYVFDRASELDHVLSMPEELADQHLDNVIPNRYSKVPQGGQSLAEMTTEPELESSNTPTDRAAKYSKAASSLVMKLRGEGRHVSHRDVLTKMIENDSEEVASLL